jgi:N-methylhydantoinase A
MHTWLPGEAEACVRYATKEEAHMLRVGIDVGGTFTDLFAWDLESGAVRTAKVLTTKDDLVRGVMDAVRLANADLRDVKVFTHGSTTATNALIERSFPEPALITTEGFRDTIEIGRQRRAHLYDPYQQKPRPLVRRRHRFVVPEKMRADGSVSRPLDERSARDVARRIRDLGMKNIAIAFINSYANPSHENLMREIVLEEIPDALVAMSSETPKFRELGRFVTTVVRAALLPVMSTYLERLETELRSHGFGGIFYVIKSNGGVMQASGARLHPEELIESGPAGGVAAAAYLSTMVGYRQIVSTDMGGTSFDVCLIEEGRGLIRDDYQIDWDMPIVTPMLDIHSIGAGGGSIAWIDEGGSLRVGPRSAGADPGPACYGRGGTEPTVTDANLVLGRLDPTLGGKLTLDVCAAEGAIRKVAEPLGLGLLECAEGIIRICAENMASAIKMVSIDRGRDPRDYALASFGGAGAMHAWAIAPSAGIDTIVVPPFAGVASAFGATIMDVRHDVDSTLYMPCDGADLSYLNQRFSQLEEEALARLAEEGFSRSEVDLVRTAGMRYIGQSYEVDTPIPSGELTEQALTQIVADFHRVHQREHGVSSEQFPTAFVNLRVTAIGKVEKLDLRSNLGTVATANGHGPTTKAQRQVYFEGAFVDCPVYDGHQLHAQAQLDGPAIVEYADSEIVVPPGAKARTDEGRNLIISTKVAL